ncbi:MAG: isoprenylcysteine carboxylmethyltransferase family protein [Thermodesulfovibrionales bacterium]
MRPKADGPLVRLAGWFGGHRLLALKLVAASCLPVVFLTHHGWAENSTLDYFFDWIGYSLIALGVAGRIWASYHIAGRKNAELVTEGPYSICRNPLYLFALLIVLGLLSLLENAVIALPVIVVVSYAYHVAMRNEEKYLSSRHGERYAEYMGSVPRLFPAFWKYRRAEGRGSFDRRLFMRGVMDTGVFLLLIPVVEALEAMHVHNVLPVLIKVF